MVWEGNSAVVGGRLLIGSTDPNVSVPVIF